MRKVKVDRYVRKIERNTIKLLKRMFGYTSLCEAIKKELELSKSIEEYTHKDIEFVTFTDVKPSVVMYYDFAKYHTLNSILNVYFESKRVSMYNNDYNSTIGD